MPTVPSSDQPVYDPFNTKTKGKDQSKPPKSGPPEATPDPPSKDYMLMAAAVMKDQGRLYKQPEVPVPPILQSARNEYWQGYEEAQKSKGSKSLESDNPDSNVLGPENPKEDA